MFSFWRSEKKFQEMLAAYLQKVDASLRLLETLFPACLDGSSNILQGGMQNPVHKEESVADDIRRDLEGELLSGKLLPGSRSEVLSIIEAVDRIPNAAEEIVDVFTIQMLRVPADLHAGYIELLAESLRACAVMSTAVSLLFEDLPRIHELAKEVDRIESRADHLERQLIQRVFLLETDLAEKLQLRDLVRALAGLSDRAENVTDRTQRLALRRKP